MNSNDLNVNRVKLSIWGREIEIKVVYDCFDNETISSEQKKALEQLISCPNLFEKTKQFVISYCLEKNAKEIGSNSIENIYKYVRPTSLYVVRSRNQQRVVALLCDYKFDTDNGLAIVFKDEEFFKIGTQDIIL